MLALAGAVAFGAVGLSSCSKGAKPSQPAATAAATGGASASAQQFPPALAAEMVDLPPDTEAAVSRAFVPGGLDDVDSNGQAYTVSQSKEEPDGAIVAVTVRDGQVKWRLPLGSLTVPPGRARPQAQVIVACSTSRAYFRTGNGVFGIADARTGKLLCQKDILSLGYVLGLAADERFGYLLMESALRAMDANSGEQRWAFFSADTLVDTAAPSPDVLLVVDGSWNIYRVNVQTGALLWKSPLLGDRLSGVTNLQSGALAASDQYAAALLPTAARPQQTEVPPSGVLTVCDSATGKVLWSKEFVQPFPARCLVVRGACVLTYLDRQRKKSLVAGFDAATGRSLWQREWQLSSWSAPGLLALAGGERGAARRDGLWLVDPQTGRDVRFIPSRSFAQCGLFSRQGKLYGFLPVLPDISPLAGTDGFQLPAG
jgi:outer membrane protein assembly factor BamB